MPSLILYSIFTVLMISLLWCLSRSDKNDESYQSFRDEHDDPRETPHTLLREDDLWDTSARDNIRDPENLINIPDPQTILHSDTWLNNEMQRTHLMQHTGTDYMGRYSHDKHNIYKGTFHNYPNYKAGGYYLSPGYEMPNEDKYESIRTGMDYHNFDHVDPLLRQIEAGLGGDELITKESYDNIGGGSQTNFQFGNQKFQTDMRDSTKNNPGGIEYMSDYGRAHIGLAKQDGKHAYMHLSQVGDPARIHELPTGYTYQPPEVFYDEEDYDNSGPGGTGPLELRDNPNHAGGMSAINMKGDSVENTFIRDAETNWYNMTNVDSSLDMENGSYGIPLPDTMNRYDPKEIDRVRHEKLAVRDVSPAQLNHDETYEYGNENFLAGKNLHNMNFSHGLDPQQPLGGQKYHSEKNLQQVSYITDVPPVPIDRRLVPYEGDMWRQSMRIPRETTNHELLVG